MTQPVNDPTIDKFNEKFMSHKAWVRLSSKYLVIYVYFIELTHLGQISNRVDKLW